MNQWDNIKTYLKENLTDLSYDAFVKPAYFIEEGEDFITLQVKNKFIQGWFTDSVLPKINNFFINNNLNKKEIKIIIAQGDEDKGDLKEQISEADVYAAPAIDSQTSLLVGKLININKNKIFDNFVEYDNNDFAAGAAKGVAKSPGKPYNPLFIYGKVGLGKTHLLHAIGNSISENFSSKSIIYISAEQFVNEFINAIKNSNIESFNYKYRSIDVLLIDDIQFLANSQKFQEVFFHVFNTLHSSERQVVIASDRPANELLNIEDRLVNRFQWGIVAEILPPEFEGRIAILMKKIEDTKKQYQIDINIPEKTIISIAENIKNNIRSLEGIITKLFAYISLKKILPDDELLAQLMNEYKNPNSNDNYINPQTILNNICNFFQINIDELKSEKRTSKLSLARQLSMYLIRKYTPLSLQGIGLIFRRSHSTVISSIDKIEKCKINKNIQILDILKQIENTLKNK